MNYSQKRTLIGRIVYIALTLMAVTVLVVTMFTFFGGSKRSDKETPIITEQNTAEDVTKAPETTVDDGVDLPMDTPEDDKSDLPTVNPVVKDWTKIKVMMPVEEGVIYKKHNLDSVVYSVTMNDYRIHKGVDIECSEGDDVLSCAYGTVKAVGYDPFMGYTVSIDHGDGLVSYYKNLSDKVADGIKEGVTVYAGQKIGTVGDSAIIEISDEPHVHFELELNDKEIDPMSILDYQEKQASVSSAEQDK